MIPRGKGIGVGFDVSLVNQYMNRGSTKFLDPAVKASLKAVVICDGKSNEDSDRAVLRNLVDKDNPFVASNFAWTEDSGYNKSTYDGALVFDGVNDRVISTKTMQEMVGDTNAVTVVSMIHQINLNSINTRNNYVRTDGDVGYIFNNVYNIGKTGIYGYKGNIGNLGNISPILGDKADYSIGENKFAKPLPVFSVNGFIEKNTYTHTSQIAWYWTIIANKVLTTDEIHQVITYYNLDKHVKPDIYYDVKKQGLTNENHATFNDKLIDYSGNGHDMQLYNIGWNGKSGIGRYLDIFNSFSPNALATRDGNYKCHVDATGYLGTMFFFHEQSTKATKSIPSFKIRLSDLSGGGGKVTPSVIYSYIDTNGSKVDTEPMVANGIYTLPESHIELVDETQVGFIISYESIATIEELPDNDGSLVLDGVNDYGEVTGVPVYKDYTVVGEYIKDSSTVNAPFVSKSEPSPKGAFIMDIGAITYSFRADTAIVNPSLNIRYQTKYFYNGKAITAGTAEDSDTLYLGTMRNNDDRFANLAFNFLMTFPYSLDEFLIERQLKRRKLGTLHPDLIEFRPIVKSDGELKEIRYYLNGWSDYVYPGDYIPKGSTININFLGLNELVEFNKLKVQGKEVSFTQQITPSGLTYIQCSGIIYNKAPLKIEVSLDNYIRFEDIQQPYPFVFSLVNAETDEEYAWGDKIKYGTKLQITKESNLLVGVYKQTIDTMFTWNGNVIAQDALMSKEFVVGKDKLVFGVQGLACEFTNEPNVIAAPQKLRLPNISYKRLGYIPDISGHGNNIKLYNSGYSGMSGANGYGTDFTVWNINSASQGKYRTLTEDFVEYEVLGTSNDLMYRRIASANETFVLYADVDTYMAYSNETKHLIDIPAGKPTKVVAPKKGTLLLWTKRKPMIGDIISIQQVGLYDGAFCFDGVNDYGQIPTLTQGGKQVFMKVNRMNKYAGFLYDQRKTTNTFTFAISGAEDTLAYEYRNTDGTTYIDAVENKHILTGDIKDITHNITALNSNVTVDNSTIPTVGSSTGATYFSMFAMYSFMLFPEISDESEIIRFNEIMGIEGKYVERPMRYFDAYGKTNQDTDKNTIVDQVTKLPANALSLKNIAYEGMSGYNGYPVVFGSSKTWDYIAASSESGYQISFNDSLITVTQISIGNILQSRQIKVDGQLTSGNSEIPSFRLKVNGIDSSKFVLRYYYLASESAVSLSNYLINSNGIHTLPKSFASNGSLTAQSAWIGFGFYGVSGTTGIVSDVNLTLEVLPDYENGLALDGVNDYLENTTLPALSDFTFITKRKNLLSTYADGTEYIRKGLDNNNRKWALLGEYWYNGKCMNYVFNRKSNDITPFDLLGFITPTNYNGTALSFSEGGVHEDSQGIYIGGYGTYWKGVFYKLMIFDMTVNMLTINMIKNMMAKDGIVDLNNPVFKNNE